MVICIDEKKQHPRLGVYSFPLGSQYVRGVRWVFEWKTTARRLGRGRWGRPFLVTCAHEGTDRDGGLPLILVTRSQEERGRRRSAARGPPRRAPCVVAKLLSSPFPLRLGDSSFLALIATETLWTTWMDKQPARMGQAGLCRCRTCPDWTGPTICWTLVVVPWRH